MRYFIDSECICDESNALEKLREICAMTEEEFEKYIEELRAKEKSDNSTP